MGQKPGKINMRHICTLDSVVSESSGIILLNDTIWTINDSGGDPAIYAIDNTNGNIISRILFPSLINADWEEICNDTTSIYIGDIGDNSNNRKQRQIYIIDAQDKRPQGVISFEFNDQTEIRQRRKHNNDCEAMISYGDSILVFTKNRGDKNSRVYIIPKQKGHYSVNPVAEIRVRGLITAASIDSTSHTLLLLGYRHYIPFVSFVSMDATGGIENDIVCKRWFFGKILRQTEAICVDRSQHAIISCEGPWIFRPHLFEIQWQMK